MELLKKVFGNIQTLLIVVLVIVILSMKTCSREKDSGEKVITKTKIEYIPIKKIVPEYVPKWKEKIVIDIDTFLANTDVDTLAILADYYAKYYFVDTLSFDTLGYALVKDTVTQNKIASRSLEYQLNIPKITVEKTIYLNQREFYYGLGIAGNLRQLNSIGGEILYKTKKKQAYGLGIGVNQNFHPIISGRIYWKIGK